MYRSSILPLDAVECDWSTTAANQSAPSRGKPRRISLAPPFLFRLFLLVLFAFVVVAVVVAAVVAVVAVVVVVVVR